MIDPARLPAAAVKASAACSANVWEQQRRSIIAAFLRALLNDDEAMQRMDEARTRAIMLGAMGKDTMVSALMAGVQEES